MEDVAVGASSGIHAVGSLAIFACARHVLILVLDHLLCLRAVRRLSLSPPGHVETMTVVALELCNTLSFKLLVSNLQLAVDAARREGLRSLRCHSDLAVVVTLRATH